VFLAWFYASYDRIKAEIAYQIVAVLFDMFMLYMLHKLSVFKGFVTDPLTGVEVPVLSMFQTAKVMEKGVKDRVLSDKQRAQIKQLSDYEEAQEMFAASEHSGSIVGSFVANDLGESMRSLRHYDVYTEAVYSEDCEVPQE